MAKVTQDYINGALEAFKILEQYKGTMTVDEIQFERNHIAGLEVVAPTEHEISKAEIMSKAAQLREFNKELIKSDELIKNIITGVEKIPVAFANLADNLSALKQ